MAGSVGSLTGVAGWARGTMASAVSAAEASTRTALRATGDGWEGDAGSAFESLATAERSRTAKLDDSLLPFAGALDDYATALVHAQATMRDIRAEAAAGGLQVSGDVIVDPGPGPGRPVVVGGALTPEGEAQYDRMMAAYEEHQQQQATYNRCIDRTDSANAALRSAQEVLCRSLDDLRGKWLLYAGDWSIALRGAYGAARSVTLGATSAALRTQIATMNSDLYRATVAGLEERFPNLVGKGAVEVKVGELKALEGALSKTEFAAGKMATLAKFAERAGPAFAVAGIGYDIATGKDPTQAVVSGGVGFAAGWGASIAAGAAIGTLVPIPVVGTVGGAIVGAAVGIFTSGAIDSLFEGGSVGDAISEGAHAVAETGEAIVDGLSSAWNSLFD
ncbi:MAG: hypothetical protein IPM08_01130 [Actinomycetales bacterium]|nr:hypothetical protein [Actinomycetales bacterium]